jgi:hypothetical protein
MLLCLAAAHIILDAPVFKISLQNWHVLEGRQARDVCMSQHEDLGFGKAGSLIK